jgi:hypothetical protein
MRKTLTSALASLLLLPLSFLPARAGVLYSLAGVVGDSNWSRADPSYNPPLAFLELYVDLSSVFQAHGGPGGLITIAFSGPPVLISHDQLGYEIISLTAYCYEPSGCVNGEGYSYSFFQSGGPVRGPTSPWRFQEGGPPVGLVSYNPIDSSLYVRNLELPPFAPYLASFEGFTEGYDGYVFDRVVSADALGQAFFLTVATIPEPAAWTMVLAGIFCIGLRLRGLKRNAVCPARSSLQR